MRSSRPLVGPPHTRLAPVATAGATGLLPGGPVAATHGPAPRRQRRGLGQPVAAHLRDKDQLGMEAST